MAELRRCTRLAPALKAAQGLQRHLKTLEDNSYFGISRVLVCLAK